MKENVGATQDCELGVDALESVCEKYRTLIEEHTGRPVPDDPWEQLELALTAVLNSWDTPRAKAYRQARGIPSDLGTAVNIQAMVFGNHGDDSGTGVVFSRNVATGEAGLYGEWLPNAQGEDVVAGVRTPRKIAELKAWSPTLYAKLDRIVRELEICYRDVVDVEFTVERGRLYILQARVAKRTPEAALTIATHLVWEKRWSKEVALERVTPEQVEAIRVPEFDASALAEAKETRLLAQGTPASPGAVVGRAALTLEEVVTATKSGIRVVLVRPDTSPDDLPGMLTAIAVVTATGGATSHAAVVARDLGKPCVVGADISGILSGDTVSVDGKTGMVVAGEVSSASATQKKEVNIFLRWWRRAKGPQAPKPRLSFDALDQPVSVNQLINDFYLSDAMTRASVGTALEFHAVKVRNETHWTCAETLAGYLAVAVGGELRHASRQRVVTSACTNAVETLLKKYKVRINGGDRREAQLEAVEALKKMSVEEQAEFFALATEVFDQGNWSGAYGGKKWGQIARAALLFFKGEMSHTVFADHAFDLQHNGGSVFGKNSMLSGSRDTVRLQLECKKKAQNVLELYRVLNSYHTPAPAVEQVFREGQELGIWEAEHNVKAA